jgi:hypothetical protein
MSKLLMSTIAAILVLAAAVGAQAQQSPSVATLPPAGAVTTAPGKPMTVAPSPQYVGPAPGATESANYANSQKPANYDNDVMTHPYTSPGMGPKPH